MVASGASSAGAAPRPAAPPGPQSVSRETSSWHHRNLGKAFYENPTTQYAGGRGAAQGARAGAGLAPRARSTTAWRCCGPARPPRGIAELEKVQKQDPRCRTPGSTSASPTSRPRSTTKAIAQFEGMVELRARRPISPLQPGRALQARPAAPTALRALRGGGAARSRPRRRRTSSSAPPTGRRARRGRRRASSATFKELKAAQDGRGGARGPGVELLLGARTTRSSRAARARRRRRRRRWRSRLTEAGDAAASDRDAATAGLPVLDADGDGRARPARLVGRRLRSAARRARGGGGRAGLDGLQAVAVAVAAATSTTTASPTSAVLAPAAASRLCAQRRAAASRPPRRRCPRGAFARRASGSTSTTTTTSTCCCSASGSSAAAQPRRRRAGATRRARLPVRRRRARSPPPCSTLVADTPGRWTSSSPTPAAPACSTAIGSAGATRPCRCRRSRRAPAASLAARRRRRRLDRPRRAGAGGRTLLLLNDARTAGVPRRARLAEPPAGAARCSPTSRTAASPTSWPAAPCHRDRRRSRGATPPLGTPAGRPAALGGPRRRRLRRRRPHRPGGASTATASLRLLANRTDGAEPLARASALEGVKNLKLARRRRGRGQGRRAATRRSSTRGVPLLFGLGAPRRGRHRAHHLAERADPERDPAAGRAPSTYKEAPRLSGSCPMIFTWNGSGFEFITDVLGVAPLGASAGDGEYFPVDHDEYVQIPRRGAGRRVDGRYEIRITEELREVAYLDQIQLIAVDHPADVEVFTNDKFKGPPFPEFRLFGVERAHPPVAARDDRGARRARPACCAATARYPDGFRARLRGRRRAAPPRPRLRRRGRGRPRGPGALAAGSTGPTAAPSWAPPQEQPAAGCVMPYAAGQGRARASGGR